jgi:diguanylate cyclase (GGDEF)-like protein/PAS domain S-box-containing protein
MVFRFLSFRSSPLTFRLTAAVAALVLVATLLVGPLALSVAERDMRAVLGDQQFAVLSSAAAFMDDRLDARLRQMDALAQAVPPAVRADPARLQAWLSDRPGAPDEFVNVAAFARNGELIATTSTMPSAQSLTVTGRAWFEDTIRRGRGLVSDPFKSRLSGAQVVLVTAPVFGPRGDVVFVLGGRVDLQNSQFLRQIDALKPGKSGYLFLMSGSGVLIDHPASERLLERIDARPGPPPAIERALQGFEGWVYGSDRLGAAIFTYKRLRTTGWILGARYPSEEAFAPMARVRHSVLAVAAVLALLAGVLGGWIVRRQLAPLDGLRRSIAAIRHGGADIGLLQVSRQDEIGELGRAFHDLVHERGRATAQMRAIADNVPAVIAYISRAQRFEFTNAAFDAMLDIASGAALGRPVRDILSERAWGRLQPLMQAAMRGEHGHTEDARQDEGQGEDKARRHLMIDTIPDFDQAGAVAGAYVLALDISERKEAELAQAASEKRLRLIADNLPVLICYIDRNHRLGFGNATFRAWLGLEPARLKGMHLGDALGGPAYDSARTRLKQAFDGIGASFEMSLQALGQHRILEWTVVPDLQADGTVAGVYALAHDMTRVKEAETRLVQMARIDALTGIANRRLFGETLAQALDRARRRRSVLGLAYLDIDHFKAINDTWGHGVGDEVLKEFAQRLGAAVRSTDSAARLAGDEFVIVLEDVKGAAEAGRVGAKVVEAMRVPFATSAGALHVTTSVGIVLADGAAALPDQELLLGRADAALYAAKRGGRDRCEVRQESGAKVG